MISLIGRRDGTADRLGDGRLVGRVVEPLAQLLGDHVDGDLAGLLAGELAAHAVGDEERAGGVESLGGCDAATLAVVDAWGATIASAVRRQALGHAIESAEAGDGEVVLVVLPVVAHGGDRANSQSGAARPRRAGRRAPVCRPGAGAATATHSQSL